MKVFVVLRFDPMQCGACGNGNIDKLFMSMREAQAYVHDSSDRRGVSWDIKEKSVDVYEVEEAIAA